MATILVVDDSASMRQMVEFTLKEAGHQVMVAEDGQAALNVAKGAAANLVITDVNMPNMDGIT
ncbi:MAG TPA: response regulator, partial [Candidatus Competibacteraceae bacterium]|nr:response regulator [Candidatus Competibacteraceae bacterium]